MCYEKKEPQYFAHSTNFEAFYDKVLEKVQKDWNHKLGNDILGLSNDKAYRILSGKQKDFKILSDMAELMQIRFDFTAER